jgi:hypothetical protein
MSPVTAYVAEPPRGAPGALDQGLKLRPADLLMTDLVPDGTREHSFKLGLRGAFRGENLVESGRPR